MGWNHQLENLASPFTRSELQHANLRCDFSDLMKTDPKTALKTTFSRQDNKTDDLPQGKRTTKTTVACPQKTSVAQKSGSAGTKSAHPKNRALAEKEKPLRCPKLRVIHFLFVWGGNRWLDMIQYGKDSQNCVQVVTTTVTTTTESAWSVEVVGNKLQLPGDLQLQNRSIFFQYIYRIDVCSWKIENHWHDVTFIGTRVILYHFLMSDRCKSDIQCIKTRIVVEWNGHRPKLF